MRQIDSMPQEPTKTVLIVDNDSGVRDLMSKVVEKMGYEPVCVDRAIRAAQYIMGNKVDAILLDLHMPGPHGDDLLAHLKRRCVPIPPTIIVSGYLHEESIGALLKFGVSGIISKPFETKRLMDELRRVLDGDSRSRYVFCPKCGTKSESDGRFCRQCGSSLDRELICSGCAAEYGPGDRFCAMCGAQVGGQEGSNG